MQDVWLRRRTYSLHMLKDAMMERGERGVGWDLHRTTIQLIQNNTHLSAKSPWAVKIGKNCNYLNLHFLFLLLWLLKEGFRQDSVTRT